MPPTRDFRVAYTKSLADQTQILTDPTQSLVSQTRAYNAQRMRVEYRSHWVSSGWGSHWPCRFHVVCVNYIRMG